MNEIKKWNDLSANDREHLTNLLGSVKSLLQEIEDFVRSLGVNLPVENLEIPKSLRISLPRGYFRKKEEFIRKYDLESIIDDPILRDNIAYALQYTDFLNYMMSRFILGHEGLSIGAVFRKYAVIHVMVVIEAIWVGFLEKIYKECYIQDNIILECDFCDMIIKHLKSKYPNHITLGVVNNFLHELSEEYPEIEIGKSYIDEINELKEYRDRVHIQKRDKNKNERVRDYFEEYSVDLYNRAVNLLKETPEVIEILLSEFRSLCIEEFYREENRP